MKRSQLISINFLNDEQLKHMTGWNSKLFDFLSNHFGRSYTSTHYALSTRDELLLTLMKYKLNLYYSTLKNLFDIDIRVVKKIVSNWTVHMYKNFKKINFWNNRNISPGQYSIILDCTEFRIEKSSDPVIQQTTYSSYYGTNTFKLLVGGTEDGYIGFISNTYGGSISDRKITEVSGILDYLKEGDFVLADRGFDISDLLEGKGIRLNIPPFKKSKQLSETDVAKTRIIATRRIVIENLIGLAKKKNKILTDKVPNYMWPIFNQIVYNCFMLINFKTPIVNCV